MQRGPLHTWSETRLLALFRQLLTQTLFPVCICVFIDGLDEYEGRYVAVIELMNIFSQYQHVKICLSNRPLVEFERAFTDLPHLRLQDLTFRSTHDYANYQLLEIVEERFSLQSHETARVQGLLDEIVWRADGVFLWAVIAIRTLRDGLLDFADLDDLSSAIDGLPDGIDSLYLQILERIKPAYLKQAIRFLQITLLHGEFPAWRVPLDLAQFNFIDRERTSEDLPLDFEKFGADLIHEQCAMLKIRLLSHTLGLLDVISEQGSYSLIGFHHRTVRDFLVANEKAQKLFASVGNKEQDIHLSIARGCLCLAFHIESGHWSYKGSHDRHTEVFSRIQFAFRHLADVEGLAGAAQSCLMHSLYGPRNLPCNETRHVNLRNGFIVLVGADESLSDIPAIAGCEGMWRFVSEILQFRAVNSLPDSIKLSDIQQFYHSQSARQR